MSWSKAQAAWVKSSQKLQKSASDDAVATARHREPTAPRPPAADHAARARAKNPIQK
ncbi:hypothetical protein RESH_04603 [Rhodopirellula europaea SH398]|uniref:Uncharacterized protein n=1 Tax=Rhodopirellula europaea SH398 TaxID=1263868 RepID=M5SAX3_9BACT|nr:hypothetical protein RESH_04603 [Rhodopirellula europaea SH398]